MKVYSLNVASPEKVIFNNKELVTSIFKKPVNTKLFLSKKGLENDKQADLTSHGGKYKALYGYSYEHYSYWGQFLEKDFSKEYGLVGENLTISTFDEKEVNSILEIGCGYGVSTWFLKDKFKSVTGLDISDNAIKSAKKIFPEIDFVKSDVMQYFDENPEKKFDVILSCYGPPVDLEKIMRHCKYFVRVGYRPKKISGATFKMTEKMQGLQLGFSTTVVSDEFKKNKISRLYFKYYFTPFFIRNLIDSFTKKFIPL